MISLRVRGPKETVTITVSLSSTFSELKELIQEKLQLEKEFDLLGGFPPKPLDFDEDVILEGKVNNNDSLRVQFVEFAGQQAVGVPKKTKAAKKPATPQKPAMVPFAGRVASLNPAPKLPSKRKSTNAERTTTRRRLSASDKASSEADISEHLLEAVNGGTGKRNKILRKVFRDAVEHQYNSAKAVSRLQAVYSGKYSIKENGGARYLGTGQSSKIDVKFHRGVGSRTYFEETVDLLSNDVLIELMKVALQDQEGMGREVLKPMNLSKCSPRIFWSLVHHHGPNLIDTIKTLLKGIDDSCESWLLERKKELSEKARENLRQKEEKEREQQAKKRRKLGLKEEEVSKEEENLIDLTHPSSSSSSSSVMPGTPLMAFLSSIPPHRLFPEDNQAALLQYFAPVSSSSSSSSSSSVLINLANHAISDQSLAALNEVQQQTSGKTSRIYEEQLESWVSLAQQHLFSVFWAAACGGGSERLRRAFEKLRIRVPSEILLWKSAPEGLLKGLVASDPALLTGIDYFWHEKLEIPVSSSSDGSKLTKEIVAKLIGYCEEFISSFPWMKELSSILLEEFQQNSSSSSADDEDVGEANWEEDWQFDPAAHEFVGQRCRVIVQSGEDEEEEEQEGEDEGSGGGKNDLKESVEGFFSKEQALFQAAYWEDGVCVCYLPPTEDEPMALWRLKLDENPKKTKKPPSSSSSSSEDSKKIGKFEDLEEHEIKRALLLCK